MAFLIVAN